MDYSAPIQHINGVGEIYAKKLAKLGVITVFDLLYHIPFRYEDRSQISQIGQVQAGETVSIIGRVEKTKSDYTKKGKAIQTINISDATGSIIITWFNQPYITKTLSVGKQVAIYGKIELFAGKKTLISPEYEIVNPAKQLIHIGRVTPIYPETAGVSSKWLRTKISQLLELLPASDLLPFYKVSWRHALKTVHFPETIGEIGEVKHRLAFDELLIYQLKGLHRKKSWDRKIHGEALNISDKDFDQFTNSLPFQLTTSQIQAISQIRQNLNMTIPMNRLLEGDVGSGKTIVAAAAAYISAKNHKQTLILAPTQILAQQHAQTLSSVFSHHNMTVGLITGSTKTAKVFEQDIIVGTHALLHTQLITKNIGLVVIDEQHRFGVLQRTLATNLGQSPHILTMTATPIPRSIALTIHGDLDVSVLNSPPSGRQIVKTWVIPQTKRDHAYQWISEQIDSTSSQVFIVCPFVQPSESAETIKSATQEVEKIKQLFPNHSVGLLHGKLSAKQKNEQIDKFKSGQFHILVTTPVVEVGIDIPNATIMLIEDADRFGLAQLHQLRGRVGRGSKQSYCLLFTNKPSPRLQALEQYHSGLELAEIDLKLRGPGDIYGISQHGIPLFKVADYSDFSLISTAKDMAISLQNQLENYPILRKLLENDKIASVQPN